MNHINHSLLIMIVFLNLLRSADHLTSIVVSFFATHGFLARWFFILAIKFCGEKFGQCHRKIIYLAHQSHEIYEGKFGGSNQKASRKGSQKRSGKLTLGQEEGFCL